MVARALLLTGNEGLAYLHGAGAAQGARWVQFQERMNRLALSAAEREQIGQAAHHFFAQIEAIFWRFTLFKANQKHF